MPTFADTVTAVGIAAWGGSMPVLSPTWTDGSALPGFSDASMTLTLGSGSWRAPLAATVMVPGAGGLPLTLLGPDGLALASTGSLVLALHPQAYLRLARLYATVLEDAAGARPQRALGLPFRPMPRWIRYAATGAHGGNVNPGDTLGTAGSCSFHDAAGMPIDPLAVASAFTALMAAHHPLQRRALGTAFADNHQVRRIAELAVAPAQVRVRLADHAGRPHDGSRLQGITALVPPVAGLFTLNASSGGGSNLTGKVTKGPASGTAFTEAQRRLIVLGPATSGRLGQSVVPPKLPAGVTLRRDFLAIRVVELGTYLRGKPEPTWDGTKVHDQPEVRLNEPVSLLADGNDVLATASAVLAGTGTEPRLAVAQTIDAAFTAPTTPGADARWPRFPATAGTAAAAGAVPVALRAGFGMTAGFRVDAAAANTDVVVVLRGLPEEAHVRVFHRLFLADAREGRGDGAAGIVHGGTVTLLLRDPLRLRPPGAVTPVAIPSQAQLVLDVVVVKRTGEARIFGDVSATISPPAALAGPALGGPNRFFTAPLRGVSHAGVLGLRPPPLPSGTTDLLGVILALTGEGQPRDASRLPTMAHRELIVAGQVSGRWRAVLSGGRLAAELHSADAQIGAPGGAGGRETQAVGLAAGNGRLAWDLARAAHRRTTRIDVRLQELAGLLPGLASGRWSQPAEPAALAAGPPSATQGTIAAAALQTIAPSCATPELALLRTANHITPGTTQFQDFGQIVEWVKERVPANLPGRQRIRDALDRLINAGLPPAVQEQLFNEVKREIMTSAYGRRDAQWALLDAIGRARHSIYIETPGFAPTQRDYAAAGLPVPPYAVDLVTALAARLNAAPGLHVTICTPREPDFGPGYEPAAAYEAKARRQAILGLPTANAVDGSRVLAFHPIGFPGRPSRLEATVVIVDDVWASVGACTLRRRGLTLDGSTDVMLTDMDLEDGVCPSLREFRRALLATRLGVSPTTPSVFGHMPDPTWARLADGVEAFHAIRERLRAGGLGRIERLWTGETPGATPMAPLSQALADPDGEEFNLVGALAIASLAGLGTF
jgi:hypothetical protein